jgi:hypothetical protein
MIEELGGGSMRQLSLAILLPLLATPCLVSSQEVALSRDYDVEFVDEFDCFAEATTYVGGEADESAAFGPPGEPNRWMFQDPPGAGFQLRTGPDGLRITGESSVSVERIIISMGYYLGPARDFELVLVVRGDVLPHDFEVGMRTMDVNCGMAFWVGSRVEETVIQWCDYCPPDVCPVVARSGPERDPNPQQHALRLVFRADTDSVSAYVNGTQVGEQIVSGLGEASQWKILVGFTTSSEAPPIDLELVKVHAGWDRRT